MDDPCCPEGDFQDFPLDSGCCGSTSGGCSSHPTDGIRGAKRGSASPLSGCLLVFLLEPSEEFRSGCSEVEEPPLVPSSALTDFVQGFSNHPL